MYKTCNHCGTGYKAKYPTSKLCFDCWKKREEAFKKYDGLVAEIALLRYRLETRTTETAPTGATIPSGMLKRLIGLCHPDRHHDTPREKVATEVSQWLNDMKH